MRANARAAVHLDPWDEVAELWGRKIDFPALKGGLELRHLDPRSAIGWGGQSHVIEEKE